jgi:anhydro-N-acetylmuramic acid kinase
MNAPASELCQGNFALGERFAEAALSLLRNHDIAPDTVDLIGSHGQTIWHQPPSAGGVPSTLQIGEPAVIAARTGIVTVADFRVADVAVGGEGAPLVPYVDWLLYRRPGERIALQNIGGIANVTLVTEAADQVIAFDNGPGNMMIDALCAHVSRGAETMDKDGALSARGRVQDDLVAELMRDDFLERAPPKSTGRERYGAEATLAWAARHANRDPYDLIATLVAFTARAIADSHRRFVARVARVLVSGGGAHNPTLMRTLAELLAPTPVQPASAAGIDVDAKEAVAFAVLAARAIRGEPGNLQAVTGAKQPAVLGKICLPPL